MTFDVAHNQPSDEVDLRELCKTLWQSKILILGITIAITCVAIAYAFLSTPIYETSIRLLPPKASDLASYNAATQLTGDAITGILEQASPRAAPPGIRELTIKTAYDAFLQQLDSDSTKLEFFDKYYLAVYGVESTEAQRQNLWKRLNKELTINLPKKSGDVVALVSFEGPDAKVIADWANRYVAITAKTTQRRFLQDLANEVHIRSKGIEDQIATLRKVAQTQREARIIRVESALLIAKSIGLDVPPAGSPLIAIGGANANERDSYANGNMMYLRGAKALQAELELLKARKSDDAYVSELDDLLKKQILLSSIDLNPQDFTVVEIDRTAPIPETPVKPRKTLILALGIIVGIILGLIAAIIRKVFI